MHIRRIVGRLAAVPMLAVMPAGCGEPPIAQEARASTIANCERQWSRMNGPEGMAQNMCRCIVNEAAERGLEMTDMFLGGEAELKDVALDCAKVHGV